MRLILASASPRRAELLRAAGFVFEIRAVDIDESARPGEAAASYVRRLAAEKSARGSIAAHTRDTPGGEARDRGDDVVVLGADTIVVIDGDIVAKPQDSAEATAMLRRLSGRR